MKIKWLGHSCFLLTSNDGIRILTDPYDESIGYHKLKVEADIVTTSHNHFDHNYVQAVQGSFIHIGQPGKAEKLGIELEGIPSFHDSNKGAERGENIIFRYTVDGIRICHCGDLGHTLAAGQVEKLGKVDVLLVPVGGYFTIDAKEAAEVVGQLKPEVVIPMHYSTKDLGEIKKHLDTAETFVRLSGLKATEYDELELDKSNLMEHAGIAILKYE